MPVLPEAFHPLIKNHTISKKAHEELMAMSHLDEDISNIFKTSEFELTNRIVEFLNSNKKKSWKSKTLKLL